MEIRQFTCYELLSLKMDHSFLVVLEELVSWMCSSNGENRSCKLNVYSKRKVTAFSA